MLGSVKKEQRSVVDRKYFDDGDSWEKSNFRLLRAGKAVWRGFALFEGFCLAGTITALIVLIPLRRTDVVTLEVDHTTGYLQVVQPLDPKGPLQQNEAVTASNIVQYIRARETYDPKGLNDNYQKALLFSRGKASQEVVDLYASTGAQNPMKAYGPDTTISVTVESLSFLNERTASVRFFTTKQTTGGQPETLYWVANVRFQYSSAPYEMNFRFDNPLGFQVFEYRRDQESIAPVVGDKDPSQ